MCLMRGVLCASDLLLFCMHPSKSHLIKQMLSFTSCSTTTATGTSMDITVTRADLLGTMIALAAH